ncbi:MAG: hypothetical protein RLZZ452_1538 [Pseudomonadota bacterium]
MQIDFFPDLPLLPEASCKDIINPDMFFPETRQERAKCLPIIRTLCAGCPVRKECLDYAIKNRIPDGWWGGLSPSQRGMKNTRKGYLEETLSSKIRALHDSGRQPEQIALLLNCQLNYVLKSIARKAKNKGEAQLEQKNEAQPKGYSSSSESQC